MAASAASSVALEVRAFRGAGPRYYARLDSQSAGSVESRHTGALGQHEGDAGVDPAFGASMRDRHHVGPAAGNEDREPQRVAAAHSMTTPRDPGGSPQ